MGGDTGDAVIAGACGIAAAILHASPYTLPFVEVGPAIGALAWFYAYVVRGE